MAFTSFFYGQGDGLPPFNSLTDTFYYTSVDTDVSGSNIVANASLPSGPSFDFRIAFDGQSYIAAAYIGDAIRAFKAYQALPGQELTWYDILDENIGEADTWGCDIISLGVGKFLIIAGSDYFAISTNSGNSWDISANAIANVNGKSRPRACYNGKQIVIIYQNSYYFLGSHDGEVWSSTDALETRAWSDVAWNGSKFVAICSDSDVFVYASDGVNNSWSESDMESGMSGAAWNSIESNGEEFIVFSGAHGWYLKTNGRDINAWSTNDAYMGTLGSHDCAWDGTGYCTIDSNHFASTYYDEGNLTFYTQSSYDLGFYQTWMTGVAGRLNSIDGSQGNIESIFWKDLVNVEYIQTDPVVTGSPRYDATKYFIRPGFYGPYYLLLFFDRPLNEISGWDALEATESNVGDRSYVRHLITVDGNGVQDTDIVIPAPDMVLGDEAVQYFIQYIGVWYSQTLGPDDNYGVQATKVRIPWRMNDGDVAITIPAGSIKISTTG